MTELAPEEAAAGTLAATGGGRAADALVAGRYRLVRLLGAGTSKRVYAARDELLERDVALGLLDGELLRAAADPRLLQEVRATARLGDHPHVVTLHDVGEADGRTFLVSQLVPGGSVADWLRRRAPAGLPVPDAVRIARGLADALAHAHAHVVIHRDVKPSNALLAEDGTALLADFGVALLAGATRRTAHGAIVGSAAYMAPEQAEGEPVDERGDLYALGATLFEMVCGRPLFEGEVLAVLLQQVHRAPPDPRAINPAVPGPLAELIGALVAKRPEQRPATAAEVRDALDALATGTRTAAAPAAPAVEPLPHPLRTDPERPLVGRGAELGAIREAWQAAAAGRGAVTLVTGEPGIGKTRLVSAFAQEAQEGGALVLFGRSDEDAPVSYQPFVDALRHLVAHRPRLEQQLDPRFAPELAELGRLVPELRGRTGTQAPRPEGWAEPQRQLLFEAVVALLGAAAGRRPLLLVLDDLHWADRPTALLLRHLLRADLPGPVLVLGTAREHELPPTNPLVGVLADLRRHAAGAERLTRLRLEGLGEDETAELVRARRPGAAAPRFVRLLRETTAGNPFFIEETLRGLRDAGLPESGDVAAQLRQVGVPAGAQEVIQRRLARLSPQAVELLTRAAVCGRTFRLDVVAAVLGTPAVQLLGPLEEAISAGLIVEPTVDRFAFCHALVRDALHLGVVSDAHRARLHLAVGEAMERIDPEGDLLVNDLALHFHEARAVGGARRAVRHALAAADRAAGALAYEEAAAHRERALAALEHLGPGHDAERCQVLHGLGRLQWQAGDREAAQATFLRVAELARGLGDAGLLARAALGFGGRWYDAERVDQRFVDLLEEALAALPEGDTPVRARLLARLADALRIRDSTARALQLGQEAVAMARRVSDDDALLDALAGRHAAILHGAGLDERLAVSDEWVALADAAGRRDVAAQARHWRVNDLVELGDVEGARREHRELGELAQRLRQPMYLHFAAAWEAKWLEMDGRFAEAEAKAEESYRLARRAQVSYADSLYAGQLYGLRRDQGRLAELLPQVEGLIGWRPSLAVWRAGLVVAQAEAGAHDEAREALDALVLDDCAVVPRDWFWLGALCLLAEACSVLGDARAAPRLRAQLEPFAERNAQIGLAVVLGPVHRFLGLLAALEGRHADARRAFEAAIERSTALGARTALGRAQCEYGELLLAEGADEDAAYARLLLERARATARRLGMGPLEERAARGLAGAPR